MLNKLKYKNVSIEKYYLGFLFETLFKENKQKVILFYVFYKYESSDFLINNIFILIKNKKNDKWNKNKQSTLNM